MAHHEPIQANRSTKEALAAKIGLYFAHSVTDEIVNIVLHVILFQLFEYQGLKILPSKILSNQGRMTYYCI